jgi:acyl-CoA dehydrogenase
MLGGADDETFALLKDSLREFVHGCLIPAEDIVEATDQISPAILREVREMGLFGLLIPRRWGGLGLSMQQEVELVFELGQASAAFRSLIGTNVGIGSQAILIAGTDAQRDRYLPPLARGEIIGAFALTEPDSGSDALSIRTSAVLDPRGGQWIINGTKRFITNAPHAGLFLREQEMDDHLTEFHAS